MEDNIPCSQLGLVGFSKDGELEMFWRAHPGAGHVQLSVAEDLPIQPHPHILECLTLGLVDGGGESRPDGELAALPLEGVFSRLGDEGDTGNEDHPVGAHNPALEQLVVYHSVEHQSGAVAETLSGVDVPQQHQRHARLEVEHVLWESVGPEGVQVLCVEAEGVAHILQGVRTAKA